MTHGHGENMQMYMIIRRVRQPRSNENNVFQFSQKPSGSNGVPRPLNMQAEAFDIAFKHFLKNGLKAIPIYKMIQSKSSNLIELKKQPVWLSSLGWTMTKLSIESYLERGSF